MSSASGSLPLIPNNNKTNKSNGINDNNNKKSHTNGSIVQHLGGRTYRLNPSRMETPRWQVMLKSLVMVLVLPVVAPILLFHTLAVYFGPVRYRNTVASMIIPIVMGKVGEKFALEREELLRSIGERRGGNNHNDDDNNNDSNNTDEKNDGDENTTESTCSASSLSSSSPSSSSPSTKTKTTKTTKTTTTTTCSVLDVGSGAGHYMKHFQHATEVVALEPLERLHEQIRKRAMEEGRLKQEQIHIYRCVVEEYVAKYIDTKRESFDYVILGNVLCEVNDQVSTLRSIDQLLKPGGIIYFSEHVGLPPGTWGRWIQNTINPWWKIAGSGCNCNCDSLTNLQTSVPGWDVIYWKYDSVKVLLGPFVLGMVQKKEKVI